MMNPIGPGGNRPNVSVFIQKGVFLCLKDGLMFSLKLLQILNKKLFSFKFPMGPGPDGPMGGMGAMEQHHMNGSLGESQQ